VIKISVGEAKNICRMGQKEKCCAYLCCGADGFECAKGSSLQPTIDARLEAGSFTAKGRGGWDGCKSVANN
jgi:hypothetical protein